MSECLFFTGLRISSRDKHVNYPEYSQETLNRTLLRDTIMSSNDIAFKIGNNPNLMVLYEMEKVR